MSAFSLPAEFSSAAPVIGEAARVAQEPLLITGKGVVHSSCELVSTAQALLANPKDATQWQQLAVHSKSVSDSIKTLVWY
jgi:talin